MQLQPRTRLQTGFQPEPDSTAVRALVSDKPSLWGHNRRDTLPARAIPITDLRPQADQVPLGPATADPPPESGESTSRVAGPQVPSVTGQGSGESEEDGPPQSQPGHSLYSRAHVSTPEPSQAHRETVPEGREAVLWGLKINKSCFLCIVQLIERLSAYTKPWISQTPQRK